MHSLRSGEGTPVAARALSAPGTAGHIREATTWAPGHVVPRAVAPDIFARETHMPVEPFGQDARESPDAGDVTELLRSARSGDRAALDRVVSLVYEDLRRMARRQLAREHGDRAVAPTTLVHEAYLKLSSHAPRAADRGHFLAIAAHAMRQVLVDHARERRAAKRGPEWGRTTLTGRAWVMEVDTDELLALDEALDRLEPRQRQVVECRFFAGMTDEETAESLGVTARTVRRDWVKARAWLNRWMREAPA